MLHQSANVRQIAGEPERLWFRDDFFDLIVWMEPGPHITGFQLCYNKKRDQHALTWQHDAGYRHNRVDDGESRPGRYKSTPILIEDGAFRKNSVLKRFWESSRDIDSAIADFVYEKIKNYPDFHTV